MASHTKMDCFKGSQEKTVDDNASSLKDQRFLLTFEETSKVSIQIQRTLFSFGHVCQNCSFLAVADFYANDTRGLLCQLGYLLFPFRCAQGRNIFSSYALLVLRSLILQRWLFLFPCEPLNLRKRTQMVHT